MPSTLIDQHAREKANAGPEWNVYLYEQLPEAKGMLLTGAVAPPLKGGPRKGRPNWRAKDKSTECRVFISRAEHDAYEVAWEQKTGKCSRCEGSSRVWAGWSRAEGTKREPCPKCSGTGQALEAKGA